jgi:5-methylcytosine-specific restriction enzyme A
LHGAQIRVTADPRSAAAAQYRRWYSTAAWRQLSAAQLWREPHCRFCLAMGRESVATQVDHQVPHRGNRERFFDPSNLISLCKPHHDATKQRLEHGRHLVPVGKDGWPVTAEKNPGKIR